MLTHIQPLFMYENVKMGSQHHFTGLLQVAQNLLPLHIL